MESLKWKILKKRCGLSSKDLEKIRKIVIKSSRALMSVIKSKKTLVTSQWTGSALIQSPIVSTHS